MFKRKGFSLFEFIMVIVVIGVAVSVIKGIAGSTLNDTEIDSNVGKSMDSMMTGYSKYKTQYYASNKQFSGLTEETFSTYSRPLKYDSTDDFLYPASYSKIKFYTGHHGAVGNTDVKAYACMDVTTMDWDSDTKKAAELKFASVARDSYSTAIIDGDAVAEYADEAAAEAAVASAPDNDGFICVTGIS